MHALLPSNSLGGVQLHRSVCGCELCNEHGAIHSTRTTCSTNIAKIKARILVNGKKIQRFSPATRTALTMTPHHGHSPSNLFEDRPSKHRAPDPTNHTAPPAPPWPAHLRGGSTSSPSLCAAAAVAAAAVASQLISIDHSRVHTERMVMAAAAVDREREA